MDAGSFALRMPISSSKDKQVMEDDDKLDKARRVERERASNKIVSYAILAEVPKQCLEQFNRLRKGLGNKVSTVKELEMAENKDNNGGASNPDGSNDGSSSMVAGDYVTVDIRLGDDNNQNEKDPFSWISLHGYVAKFSGGGAAVKIWLSDGGSRDTSTFRVIIAMDGVALVTSSVGYIVDGKHPTLSKFCGIIGGYAAVFMVFASLVEFAFPEHALLISAFASLPPLLALADRAFDFNKYVPSFLTDLPSHVKRLFGFIAAPPSPT